MEKKAHAQIIHYKTTYLTDRIINPCAAKIYIYTKVYKILINSQA